MTILLPSSSLSSFPSLFSLRHVPLRCLLVSVLLLCASCLCAQDGSADGTVVSQDAPVEKNIVVGIDQSRSSRHARFLDRVRLMTDTLLPACAPTTVSTVDSQVLPVSGNRIGAIQADARHSDYLLLFDVIAPIVDDVQTAQGTRQQVIVLVGDGCVEAVGANMSPNYLSWAQTASGDQRPTRDVINRAITQHLQTTHAEMRVAKNTFWILLDPQAMPRKTSLWPWLLGDGTRGVRLAAGSSMDTAAQQDFLKSMIAALIQAEVLDAQRVLRFTATTDTQTVAIPEGCEQLGVYMSLRGDNDEVGISLDGVELPMIVAGEQTPSQGAWGEWVDRIGVARCVQIHGCIAGGELRLTGTLSEAYGLIDRFVGHSMAVVMKENMRGVFKNQRIALAHTFVRSDGVAITETLRTTLLDHMKLDMDGAAITDDTQIVLPDAEKTVVISARFAQEPWVESTPLEINPLSSGDMVLSGGWHDEKMFAGDTVTLSLKRSGGRYTHSDITLVVANGINGTETLTLLADSADVDLYSVTVETTDAWIAHWSLPKQVDCDTETATVLVQDAVADIVADPSAQRYAQLEVQWDWRMWAVIAAVIALILIGLFLWWFLTRPKWADEMVYYDGSAHRLSALPGVKARHTSHAVAAMKPDVLLTKTRGGLQLSRVKESRAQCFVNGAPQTLDQALEIVPGNDIETVAADGTRTHVRLFASEEEGSSWAAEQAQIDLEKDFESMHFIIEAEEA